MSSPSALTRKAKKLFLEANMEGLTVKSDSWTGCGIVKAPADKLEQAREVIAKANLEVSDIKHFSILGDMFYFKTFDAPT